MRYQGGKSRIAVPIAQAIERERERENNAAFVSLFCGACSVEAVLAPFFDKVICNDNHYYLIEMFKGLQMGCVLPDTISKDEYYYIKEHKDENPCLTGLVGFGCSFSGKWFGGYAKDGKGKRNYYDEANRSMNNVARILQSAEFTCLDYRDVRLPENCIIYADPPYNNTTGYSGGKFDNNAFWEYARQVSQDHLMFISEQEAPEDFISIWEKPYTRTIDRNKSNMVKTTEKLFIHKCNSKE